MFKKKDIEYKTVPIGTIKQNPTNPRVITGEQLDKLMQSVEDFEVMLRIRPIVCNSDGMIIGGNMRYEACKLAGHKEVFVCYAHGLTEDQQREFIIKDNTEGGSWDYDVLQDDWEHDLLEKWGLDIPEWDLPPDSPDPVNEFSESENFIIKCENDKQLEDLKAILGTEKKNMSFDDFNDWRHTE